MKLLPNTAIYYDMTSCPEEMRWYDYRWEYDGIVGVRHVACFDQNDFFTLLKYWNRGQKIHYLPLDKSRK